MFRVLGMYNFEFTVIIYILCLWTHSEFLEIHFIQFFVLCQSPTLDSVQDWSFRLSIGIRVQLLKTTRFIAQSSRQRYLSHNSNMNFQFLVDLGLGLQRKKNPNCYRYDTFEGSSLCFHGQKILISFWKIYNFNRSKYQDPLNESLLAFTVIYKCLLSISTC